MSHFYNNEYRLTWIFRSSFFYVAMLCSEPKKEDLTGLVNKSEHDRVSFGAWDWSLLGFYWGNCLHCSTFWSFCIAWGHACERSVASYLRTSAYAKVERNMARSFIVCDPRNADLNISLVSIRLIILVLCRCLIFSNRKSKNCTRWTKALRILYKYNVMLTR